MLYFLGCFHFFALLASFCTSTTSSASYAPIVQELKNYVESNKTFAFALNQTFLEACTLNDIEMITFPDMYSFFNTVLVFAPNASRVRYVANRMYNYTATTTGNTLILEPRSIQWMGRWLDTWRLFLDSPNSTTVLPSWYEQTNMSDFIIPEGGYSSLNAFFGRTLQPGARPISYSSSNSIIISPGDGNLHQIVTDLRVDDIASSSNSNSNSSASMFDIKGVTYNIRGILGSVDKAQLFEGGTLVQIGLNVFDYHWVHAWADGYITEIDEFGGSYYYTPANMSMSESNIDTISAALDEFNRRNVIYVQHEENSEAVSALVVVGMADISSVNMIVTPRMTVKKGDKLGYMSYGGSAVALLFQKGAIESFRAQAGDKVQMGEILAVAN